MKKILWIEYRTAEGNKWVQSFLIDGLIKISATGNRKYFPINVNPNALR